MANTDLTTWVDPQREEREAKLKAYNANDHLKKWSAFNNKTGLSETVTYYPAGWRLYELGLRHPTANFSIEIIHINYDKDFVLLRARLFFGEEYEKSPKRSEALKQGKVSLIDKVETAAKARAARDFGIGTEHALDMDDATVEGTVVGSSLVSDERGMAVNLANSQQRQNIEKLCGVLERDCPDFAEMTYEQAGVILKGLSEQAKERAAQKKTPKQNVRIVPSEPPAEPNEEAPQEINPAKSNQVAFLHNRVESVKPQNSKGVLTLEDYYASIFNQPYPGDEALPMHEWSRMIKDLKDLEARRKAPPTEAKAS